MDKPQARVLVVDDLQMNRAIYGAFFEQAGALVDRADSGAAAVELVKASLAENRPYDLVIVDIIMPPGLSGHEAAVQMRASGFRGGIVALTAMPTAKGRKKSGQSGIDAYLSKSVLTKELAVTLVRQYHSSPQKKAP